MKSAKLKLNRQNNQFNKTKQTQPSGLGINYGIIFNN